MSLLEKTCMVSRPKLCLPRLNKVFKAIPDIRSILPIRISNKVDCVKRMPSAAKKPIDFSLIFRHRRLHTHGYKNLHKRSDRPQCKHLFHMITSLDMTRLYLTLKTNIKIKIPGTPPSLE